MRPVFLPRSVFVLAPLAVIAGLWWRAVPIRPAPLAVVLITLDTTRADRLPAYGYMDASMPHLDRLAREGVVFDQATSVAPLTLPAHCSLFTGLYPPRHGVRDNADPALRTDQTTLAEILRAQGFRTGAFVGSVVLDADRGLEQGFDHYSGVGRERVIEETTADSRTASRQRRADEVVDDATRWLDDVPDSRFFLWAHLYDAHRPYDPPEPYRSRYFDPYIGEIAFADAQIGRLLGALERRHLLDRTIVIVAGDHGESLGDHGERDHGIFIYESVLRVPLIIRAPGVLPRRIGAVVRLTDLMPTVLDVLDLPVPPVDGVSLVDLIAGRRGDLDLEAFSESMYPQRFGWSPLLALRDRRFKLIDAPRPELYDLQRDPFEERNVYDERRAVAEAMTRRVRALASGGQSGPGSAGEQPAVPAGLRERLAALGYVAAGPISGASPRKHLPDPKDCISLHNARSARSGTAATIASSHCN